VIDERKLANAGNLTLLDIVDREFPGLFQDEGPTLAVVARGGDVTNRVEPLLLVDGVRIHGFIADELRNTKAHDVTRVELQIGAAAGWEYQPGGSQAVIEVTTRKTLDPDSSTGAQTCPNPDRR
jgi:hypothetical protein